MCLTFTRPFFSQDVKTKMGAVQLCSCTMFWQGNDICDYLLFVITSIHPFTDNTVGCKRGQLRLVLNLQMMDWWIKILFLSYKYYYSRTVLSTDIIPADTLHQRTEQVQLLKLLNRLFHPNVCPVVWPSAGEVQYYIPPILPSKPCP